MEFPSITATRSPFRTPSDSKPRARALLRASNSEYETLSFWCLEMTLTRQLSQSTHPSTQSKWYITHAVLSPYSLTMLAKWSPTVDSSRGGYVYE